MIEYTATLARMEITNARNDDELECAVEPFLTSPFYGGDCDVLYGNASQGIPNQFLQDVDYSTDATRPVNYLLIQNNTAQKATVPESHYTQLSSANIRYNGSKIQSETINTFTTTHFEISQSHYLTGSFQNNTVKQITETDFNKPFNIGNFGSTPSTDVIPVYAIYFEDAFTQHSTGNSSNGAYVTFVTPKVPVITNDSLTYCEGETVDSLRAKAATAGASIKWYDDAVKTTLLKTDTV